MYIYISIRISIYAWNIDHSKMICLSKMVTLDSYTEFFRGLYNIIVSVGVNPCAHLKIPFVVIIIVSKAGGLLEAWLHMSYVLFNNRNNYEPKIELIDQYILKKMA